MARYIVDDDVRNVSVSRVNVSARLRVRTESQNPKRATIALA
jgi:hypothetical protein